MISFAHIEATPHANPANKVIISSFGAEEIASIQPFDPASAPHETAGVVRTLLTAAPEELTREMEKDPRTQFFGVFAGGTRPQDFAGIVTLNPLVMGGGEYDPIWYIYETQTLGAHIYNSKHQRKGIGTAAIFAVMEHAIAEAETNTFAACTSVNNVAMQRTLQHLGFSLVRDFGDVGQVRHYDDSVSKLEEWHFYLRGSIRETTTHPYAPSHSALAFGAVAAQHTVRTL